MTRLSVARWASAPLSYAEVGATLDESLPAGYHHVEVVAALGTGRAAFEAASTYVLTLGMHRATGNTVLASQLPVTEGAVVVQEQRIGPLRFAAPCRVVRVLDTPTRSGFAYGSLVGHPESGEELFEVRIDDAEQVTVRIRAFSRQARWYSRSAPPLVRRVQRWVTARYVQALARAVAQDTATASPSGDAAARRSSSRSLRYSRSE